MSIFSPGFLGIAGAIAAMTAAMERGDVDEASRQGVRAGPAVLEEALASKSRPTVLAAIAAAPAVEARAELLPALTTVAGSGDRRVAIPAARAARTITRELAQAAAGGALPDDLDAEDLTTARALLLPLATNPHRFIEVRVLALDAVAALAEVAHEPVGYDLAGALADPDPDYRTTAIELLPRPTPQAALAPLSSTVLTDADPDVARTAANVLCGDDPVGARALLGSQGLDRVKTLVGSTAPRTNRDARRCLAR